MKKRILEAVIVAGLVYITERLVDHVLHPVSAKDKEEKKDD